MPLIRLRSMLLLLTLTFLADSTRSEDLQFASMNALLLEQSQRIGQLEAELASFQADDLGVKGSWDKGGLDWNCGASYGLYGGVEATLLKAYNNALSVDIAELGSGTLLATYDAEVSPRVWLGYEGTEGLGVRATYWGYDHATHGGGIEEITLGLEAYTVDLEITQAGSFCDWDLGVSAGVRWAKIEDTLRINVPDFSDDPLVIAGGMLDLVRDFEGLGPTVALTTRRPVCGGLALIGGFRASLLYGESSASLTEGIGIVYDGDPINANGSLVADDHLLQIYEIRLGGEWSRELDSGARLFTRLVYEAQAWNLAPIALGLLDSNVGFAGPSIAMGLDR